MFDRRLALALAPTPLTPDDAPTQSNHLTSQQSQSNEPSDLPPNTAMISTWKLSMLFNALVKLRATKDHLTHPAQTSLARLTRLALSAQSNSPSQSHQSNRPSQTNDARAISNVLYFVAKLRWPVLTQGLQMGEPHSRQGLAHQDNNTEGDEGRESSCIVTRALVRSYIGVMFARRYP